MSSWTTIPWESVFLSHAGASRVANEDAWLEAPDLGLWAVADGMGGHEAGQVASRIVIDALDTNISADDKSVFVSEIKARLCAANQQLREIADERYEGRIIGSTVAVLLVFGRESICLWVGDSRIYRYRDGRLIQLTTDHSHVQDLVEKGHLDVEDVRRHRLSNVLTRAIGAQDELLIDTEAYEYRSGDAFLLCSDGLNKTVSDDEICQTLKEGTCDEIVGALLHLSLMRGVTDNVTIGIVRAP